MEKNQDLHFPPRVARRILQLGAKGRKALVLVMKKGKPSRVFGFDEYLARKALVMKVKPWQGRKKKATSADPLGAVDLGVMAPLTRENMYD